MKKDKEKKDKEKKEKKKRRTKKYMQGLCYLEVLELRPDSKGPRC